VIAVHDNDLVADDEIHVTTPFGVDFDERRRNLNDAHTGWHRSADPDREVYVACARHVASHQDRVPDPGPLLGRQVDRAAATTLALLSSALRRLTLLALLTLRGLALLRRALVALGLRGALALVALTLACALISLALTTLRLALLALVLLTLRALIPLTLSTLLLLTLSALILLRRLSRGLIPLTLTALGLTLLLLRSLLLLRLAAATLRGLRSILARAAARRSLALRAGAGLSPARHVLG
jgi:hypothetical protein